MVSCPECGVVYWNKAYTDNNICPDCGSRCVPSTEDSDSVNRPKHYTMGKVECIDAIKSALGDEGFEAFLRGQIIKYIWRMNHKGGLEDAKKAQWYLNMLCGDPPRGNREG